MSFRNRTDAGRRLARLLEKYRGTDAVVLGLPRGGVPVAFAVADALGLPLDVLIVRKLGAPIQPELAMGAIAEGGAEYVDDRIVDEVGATDEDLAEIIAQQTREVARRVQMWRQGKPPVDVAGKTAIVVDDGIATGATVRAALRALRTRGPSRIVLAVPVAPPPALEMLREETDEIACVEVDPYLWAIGASYEDFTQVDDERVSELLERAAAQQGAARAD